MTGILICSTFGGPAAPQSWLHQPGNQMAESQPPLRSVSFPSLSWSWRTAHGNDDPNGFIQTQRVTRLRSIYQSDATSLSELPMSWFKVESTCWETCCPGLTMAQVLHCGQLLLRLSWRLAPAQLVPDGGIMTRFWNQDPFSLPQGWTEARPSPVNRTETKDKQGNFFLVSLSTKPPSDLWWKGLPPAPSSFLPLITCKFQPQRVSVVLLMW